MKMSHRRTVAVDLGCCGDAASVLTFITTVAASNTARERRICHISAEGSREVIM